MWLWPMNTDTWKICFSFFFSFHIHLCDRSKLSNVKHFEKFQWKYHVEGPMLNGHLTHFFMVKSRFKVVFHSVKIAARAE